MAFVPDDPTRTNGAYGEYKTRLARGEQYALVAGRDRAVQSDLAQRAHAAGRALQGRSGLVDPVPSRDGLQLRGGSSRRLDEAEDLGVRFARTPELRMHERFDDRLEIHFECRQKFPKVAGVSAELLGRAIELRCHFSQNQTNLLERVDDHSPFEKLTRVRASDPAGERPVSTREELLSNEKGEDLASLLFQRGKSPGAGPSVDDAFGFLDERDQNHFHPLDELRQAILRWVDEILQQNSIGFLGHDRDSQQPPRSLQKFLHSFR